MNNYILLKHLDQNSIERMNEETEKTKKLNNNELKKALEAGAILDDGRECQSCYISSRYIYGLYFPNNEYKSILNGARFVCVSAWGVVLDFSNNYFLMIIKKLNLKNTLIMEGRGCDTHNGDPVYKNFRYFSEVTPSKKILYYNRESEKNETIKKLYFEFGGGVPFGFFVNGGKYKHRAENPRKNYYLYFNCSADLVDGTCWGFNPERWTDPQNIFKTYNNYIKNLDLEAVSIKNGKKWTTEEKTTHNNFIIYNNNNILKIINYLTQKNFKNILNNWSVYDIATAKRIYN